MPNWKLSLTAILVFTFIGLPAIGQETGNETLQKLDVLSWSSELMMKGGESSEVILAEDSHQEPGEFSELKEGLHKLDPTDEVELAVEKHSLAGESEGSNQFIEYLKKVFGSAMSF